MSEAQRLLEQATPLPWVQGADDINGEVDGYEDFPVISTTWATKEDAALIVYAVNRLPDYEAAVDALEELLPTVPHLIVPEAAVRARAALRRLRGTE